MVESVVHIVGVKVKGRILVNRDQLCQVLGIQSGTLTNRMKQLRGAQVETAVGVTMYDLERALSIKVLPKLEK